MDNFNEMVDVPPAIIFGGFILIPIFTVFFNLTMCEFCKKRRYEMRRKEQEIKNKEKLKKREERDYPRKEKADEYWKCKEKGIKDKSF